MQRMLEQIGFKYVERIDPFDGGPHYEAKIADVSVIQQYRACRLSTRELNQPSNGALVASERASGRNRFRAVKTQVAFDNRQALIPLEARELLQARPGAAIGIVPFP